jgi:hypothetical protein
MPSFKRHFTKSPITYTRETLYAKQQNKLGKLGNHETGHGRFVEFLHPIHERGGFPATDAALRRWTGKAGFRLAP